MLMKAFILSVFLHYPPDPDLVLEYYFISSSACEAKGREIENAWLHLRETHDTAFLIWDCTETREIEIQ